MKKHFILFGVSLLFLNIVLAQKTFTKAEKDTAWVRFVTNGLNKYGMYCTQGQFYTDSILRYFPERDDIWQQRSTPLFKQGKYELGMQYLNQAIALNRKEYIDYRAFINCIFTKQHTQAIADYKEAIANNGGNDNYNFDHPHTFYIGLSYLQLNQLDSATYYLQQAVAHERKTKSEGFLSPTHWFYLGIVAYDQKQWQTAIDYFDKALFLINDFPEAKFYKAYCLYKLGQKPAAIMTITEAIQAYHADYLFPEYNAVYEKYPYQVTKQTMQSYLERWSQ